jgi:nucleoside-diphosphate-sugar epimerase
MVQGLLLALDSEQAVGKIYNIGTDQPVTQARYLSLIAQEIGAPAPRLRVPYTALFTVAYMAERLAGASNNRIRPFLTRHGVKLYGANNLMSIDKARRELGYVPQVSVADAVRMACDWYQHRDSVATAAPRGALTAVNRDGRRPARAPTVGCPAKEVHT